LEDTEIDALLERLHSGDGATADRVYREFEPLLRRIVRGRLSTRVRGRFDSDDVVQSAWISILSGLRDGRWKFRDAGHLRSFLVRIALFRLYDRAGAAIEECGREVPLPDSGRDRAGGDPSPSEHVRAAEVWERLLAVCPPEHHTILHGRRAGESCEEIAAKTGHHPGSVRRILRQLARRVAFDGLKARPDPRAVP
jgi:DNA-directed RNA polymerase specialized sigma24 family protein